MTAKQLLSLFRLEDLQRVAKKIGIEGRSSMSKKQLVNHLLRQKNPILMVGNTKRKNPILMVGNPKKKSKRKRSK